MGRIESEFGEFLESSGNSDSVGPALLYEQTGSGGGVFVVFGKDKDATSFTFRSPQFDTDVVTEDATDGIVHCAGDGDGDIGDRTDVQDKDVGGGGGFAGSVRRNNDGNNGRFRVYIVNGFSIRIAIVYESDNPASRDAVKYFVSATSNGAVRQDNDVL